MWASMTISFSDALEKSDACRSLLLGNGFSIAQAGGQFSYSSLLEKTELPPDSAIRKVFTTLDTFDFELVMHALQHAAQIEDAYGAADRAKTFRDDAAAVREALIHAVRAVHPGIQFDIPEEQRETCGKFLKHFDNVFTLNYDLLLYWVILKVGGNHFSDGFGLGGEAGGFRTFSEDAMCNTFYLHGALHLFLGSQRDTLKRIVTSGTIINDIATTIRTRRQLPLFVAEGLSSEKMARINSVPYLRYAYDKLSELSGSLFIFGHSVAANDRHLYDAIFDPHSAITKLFVCVHSPENNLQSTKENLAPFRERNKKIDVIYVDSATASVWK
jgi:hypothetical protein